MSRIVIALGGNALGSTPQEQLALVRRTAQPLASLLAAGHQLVVTHGNGPQVGMIQLGMSAAAGAGVIAGEMPFPECGAMSQGYIGYHLQNALRNELHARGMRQGVASIVTQVLVSADDPAFSHPTKPIGAFYSEETARRLMAERGWAMAEDAGRGWRQVVPSPMPLDVVELESIRSFLDAGHTVIACGGGGIPVVLEDGALRGVAAVIDKDFASEKLAELLGADQLVILTAVDRVVLHFGTPDARAIERMSAGEAEEYCAEGHFAPGSMLPKVQAALRFARAGGRAVITSLERAAEALDGRCGTVIEG